MIGSVDSALISFGEMSWLAFGLSVFFKGTLVLALAAAANLALRGASASTRHLVWTLAFLAVAALPLATLLLPAWQVPISTQLLTPAPNMPREMLEERSALGVREALQEERISSPAPRSTGVPELGNISLSWKAVASTLWLGGLLAVALRLIAGLAAIRLEVQRAKEVTDESWSRLLRDLASRIGIAREVRLYQTHRSMVPVASGFLHPKVLLPSGADRWSAECRRGVLLHELGHVKRGDCLTQILIQVACAAYWWNPLVWYAARKLRQESERACDDLVLDAGTRASDYAHNLLDMARVLATTHRSLFAGATLAHRSRLEDRLLAILDPKIARHRLGRVSILAVVVFCGAVLVPFAALEPTVQAVQSTASSFEREMRSESVEYTSQLDETPQQEPIPQPTPEQEERSVVNERTIRALLAALEDPVPEVREQAMATLARMRSPETVGPMIEILRNGNEDNREEAARALGMIEDTRAVAPLISSLGDEVSTVREAAAWALGMIRASAGVDALMGALSDPEPDVREQAAWALGMIQDDRSQEALAVALEDEDPKVREQSAWALGMVEASAGVDALMGALSDPEPDVREQAAWALGMIQDDRSQEALAVALEDEDPKVREQSAWALGMIEASAGVDALMGALKDSEPDVREQAAWALGMIQDTSAVEALSEALSDEEPEVRGQAAWALGMLAFGHEDNP